MKGKSYWVCGEEWSDNDLNQLKCISWWPRQPGEGERGSQSRSWLFWSRRWWRKWLTLLGRPWSVQTPPRTRWVGWCSSTGQGRLTWLDQRLWSSQLYLWEMSHVTASAVSPKNAWNNFFNVTSVFVDLHFTCRKQAGLLIMQHTKRMNVTLNISKQALVVEQDMYVCSCYWNWCMYKTLLVTLATVFLLCQPTQPCTSRYTCVHADNRQFIKYHGECCHGC